MGDRVVPVSGMFVMDGEGETYTLPRVQGFLEGYKALCRQHGLAFSHQEGVGSDPDTFELTELDRAQAETFVCPELSWSIPEYRAAQDEAARRRAERGRREQAALRAEMASNRRRAEETKAGRERRDEARLLREGIVLPSGKYRLVRDD